MRPSALFTAAILVGMLAWHAQSAPRVQSLDQCADQYVLALSPRAAIVGLSKRVLNADSYLAAQARGLPRRRASSEAVLATGPAVVVRYWGGEPRLLADLTARGVTVVNIEDATDFAGVRANVRKVALALGQPAAGEALIARMDRKLAASAGAWRGAGALYLTSGGATAGQGTLIDAMMRAAGMTNLAGASGYHAVSFEGLVLWPPRALVLGFFDSPTDVFQRWSFGRHQSLRRLAEHRAVVSLPGAILGCPAWFAADGAWTIAQAGRRESGAP